MYQISDKKENLRFIMQGEGEEEEEEDKKSRKGKEEKGKIG